MVRVVQEDVTRLEITVHHLAGFLLVKILHRQSNLQCSGDAIIQRRQRDRPLHLAAASTVQPLLERLPQKLRHHPGVVRRVERRPNQLQDETVSLSRQCVQLLDEEAHPALVAVEEIWEDALHRHVQPSPHSLVDLRRASFTNFLPQLNLDIHTIQTIQPGLVREGGEFGMV